MELTIKAKIKILPTEDQRKLLDDTRRAYRDGCNYVSDFVYETEILDLVKPILLS